MPVDKTCLIRSQRVGDRDSLAFRRDRGAIDDHSHSTSQASLAFIHAAMCRILAPAQGGSICNDERRCRDAALRPPSWEEEKGPLPPLTDMGFKDEETVFEYLGGLNFIYTLYRLALSQTT